MLPECQSENSRLRAQLCHLEEENDMLRKENAGIMQDLKCETSRCDRLQGQLREKELELSVVKRQLEQFQMIQMEDIMQRRAKTLKEYEDSYKRTHPQQMQLTQKVGDTASVYVFPDLTKDLAMCDEDVATDLGPIVSHPPPPGVLTGACASFSPSHLTGALLQTGNKSQEQFMGEVKQSIPHTEQYSMEDEEEDYILECPSCSKHFPESQLEDFLYHSEHCI